MIYTVVITRAARKAIAAIQSQDRGRIEAAIRALATEPRPHGCKKLKDSDYWRVRVGDYRIIYLIEDDQVVVTVATVANRKDAY